MERVVTRLHLQRLPELYYIKDRSPFCKKPEELQRWSACILLCFVLFGFELFEFIKGRAGAEWQTEESGCLLPQIIILM